LIKRKEEEEFLEEERKKNPNVQEKLLLLKRQMAPKREENKSYDYEFALLKKPTKLRKRSFDFYEPIENFDFDGERV